MVRRRGTYAPQLPKTHGEMLEEARRRGVLWAERAYNALFEGYNWGNKFKPMSDHRTNLAAHEQVADLLGAVDPRAQEIVLACYTAARDAFNRKVEEREEPSSTLPDAKIDPVIRR